MIEIKSFLSDRQLFAADVETLKECVELAARERKELLAAELPRANLRWARLREAVFTSACLAGADLQSADMRGACLFRANLHGARLPWADVTGADLNGVHLLGADLAGPYIIDGGQEQRGARFVGHIGKSGRLKIAAGCRYYTLAQARKHWGAKSYHGSPEQAADCLRRVELIAAEAKARGWPL